jgi:hypothetical protein
LFGQPDQQQRLDRAAKKSQEAYMGASVDKLYAMLHPREIEEADIEREELECFSEKFLAPVMQQAEIVPGTTRIVELNSYRKAIEWEIEYEGQRIPHSIDVFDDGDASYTILGGIVAAPFGLLYYDDVENAPNDLNRSITAVRIGLRENIDEIKACGLTHTFDHNEMKARPFRTP